ncbi:hypothetical protein F4802DRAFT_620525 [Xylaria palmicola]|nr:hypothetical protein F4802DRAFT_620525 [Xylaria palmicola]
MPQHKRKVSQASPPGSHLHSRKLQRHSSPEWAKADRISAGDIESVKHLVSRLRGGVDSNRKELSPVKAKPRPGHEGHSPPTIRATDLPQVLSECLQLSSIKKEHWSRVIRPGLIRVLLKANTEGRFEAAELHAMLSIILGDQGPRIRHEDSFASVFSCQPNHAFGSSVVRSIGRHDAKIFVFGGNRPARDCAASDITWYLIIVDVGERVMYFIDPDSSDGRLSERQWSILLHMRELWEQDVYPKYPDIPSPDRAINLRLVQQNELVSSGWACIISAYLLIRQPEQVFNCIKAEDTRFEVSHAHIAALIKSFEDCLQCNLYPEWIFSNAVGKDASQDFDESLVNLALSVKIGNGDNLTELVRSLHNRLPTTSNCFSLPSHTGTLAIKPANTAVYRSQAAQASALLPVKKSQDRSDPNIWKENIAPRIKSMLLRMAGHTRPSTSEISAYFHMVLGDFFDGQRTPKAMTENTFGDFLKENVLRDKEWDHSVMERKPRFLVLGRGQDMGADYYHWYVIIVDMETKKAYCFDSMAVQDNRAEHIQAFAILQKHWAVRLSRIPVPDYMIELPSFTHKDCYSSGFLCMHHIALLFRNPLGLKKLKHGDVTAKQKNFNRVTKLAKSYLGIEAEGRQEDMMFNSKLIPQLNDSNNDWSLQKKDSTKLESTTPQGKPETNWEHKKYGRKKGTAMESPRGIGSFLSGLFGAGDTRDSGPGVDSPKGSPTAGVPKYTKDSAFEDNVPLKTSRASRRRPR